MNETEQKIWEWKVYVSYLIDERKVLYIVHGITRS